jgi:hypothetical protein
MRVKLEMAALRISAIRRRTSERHAAADAAAFPANGLCAGEIRKAWMR